MFDYREIADRALLRAGEIKSEKQRRHKRLKTVFIAMGVCALAFAFVIMPAISGPRTPGTSVVDDPVPLAGLPPPLDSGAKTISGTEPANGSSVVLPYYDKITVPAGTPDVKIMLLNPEGNPCYFAFEITADGETLYASGLVGPGKYIEDLTLSKGLPKGEYSAELKIHAYALDNYALISDTYAPITIIAEASEEKP